MKKITLNEDVFVVEDFLTAEECDALIQKSEDIGYEAAKVQIDGGQTLMTQVRNNERILFENKDLAEELWLKSKAFLPSEKGIYEATGLNEMFRFYKYSVGQRFKMHRDGSFIKNENECSWYTFMIYLNDNFEGGETTFKDLFTVNPKKGSLLVFYHPLKHEGKMLIDGFKYVLRSDVMYSIKQ